MKAFSFFLLCIVSHFSLAEKAPDSLLQLVPELKKWGSEPLLIKQVKNQNSQGLTLDKIKKRDSEWRATDGLDSDMKALMENDAAKKMLEMEEAAGFLFESFLMDNQGANVAMTNKTSDYWQGDESKFTESFKNGKGAVHVGDVEFDDSAQAYLVQISVPVMEGGSAIGAITIGINIDEYEAQQ